MNKERTGRILKALKEMGLTQMLIVDPMSIFYLTGVQVAPFERFYGLYLREDGRHAYFLNRLFHVPEDTGVEKVWYSDMDPVMELVAQHVDKEQVLGVDRELKAGFLLPLMELKAAKDFAEASDAVDRTRAVKDEEEQEKMRLSSRINDLAMERFKDLIREGITEAEAASGCWISTVLLGQTASPSSHWWLSESMPPIRIMLLTERFSGREMRFSLMWVVSETDIVPT